ncbi:MAG: flagellar protein FlaG [Candidatus Brocadiales bacterium]
MSKVENVGNAISESGLLRERIKNTYPLPKGTERAHAGEMKRRDSSSLIQNDTLNITLSGAGQLPEKAASEPKIKLKDLETNLDFVYDGEIKKAILRVVDEETKKVILQLPPEEAVAKMKEDSKKGGEGMPAGIVIDKNV